MAALTRNISIAAGRLYEMVEEILLYSEKETKWIGALSVVYVTGRMITIKTFGEEKAKYSTLFKLSLPIALTTSI